jgi:hypothetical protein
MRHNSFGESFLSMIYDFEHSDFSESRLLAIEQDILESTQMSLLLAYCRRRCR